jgi:hypothetical protein
MDQTPDRYIAQFYESAESKLSPFASTPDDSLWKTEGPFNLSQAMMIGKNWTVSGFNKTCRVLELDENGQPKAIVWLSAWERPMQQDAAGSGGAPGLPGQSIKIQVWMNRDLGPSDHWDWGVLNGYLNDNVNSWELVYGRELDRKGKMILWTLRFNLYPGPDHRDPIDWPWYQVFGYDEKHKYQVEAIRAHPIDPKEFPDGAPKVECSACTRIIVRSEAWWSYVDGYEEDPSFDDSQEGIAPFCSCKCIDNYYNEYTWRRSPAGEETDEPGCVWEIEKLEAMV